MSLGLKKIKITKRDYCMEQKSTQMLLKNNTILRDSKCVPKEAPHFEIIDFPPPTADCARQHVL